MVFWRDLGLRFRLKIHHKARPPQQQNCGLGRNHSGSLWSVDTFEVLPWAVKYPTILKDFRGITGVRASILEQFKGLFLGELLLFILGSQKPFGLKKPEEIPLQKKNVWKKNILSPQK